MKAIILAGGLGSRLSEETINYPKPMVEIGGRPILWHIMNHYASHGIKEFIICLGYKGDHIKKFFLDYTYNLSDFTINLSEGEVNVHKQKVEDWKVTLLDTGLNTMTGGRIKRVINYFNLNSPFCMTYGDGLSDVNVSSVIDYHKLHGKKCTITAVTPPGRFGMLDIDLENNVNGFREKIASDQYQINAGFFVLDPIVENNIKNDNCIWEQEPMKILAAEGQIKAWKHYGFWQPMDTLRDKNLLQKYWDSGNPPWLSKL